MKRSCTICTCSNVCHYLMGVKDLFDQLAVTIYDLEGKDPELRERIMKLSALNCSYYQEKR